MIYGHGESALSDQLLKAHGHVWNQIFSFINSMSLKCAVQLGIPDAINNHGKPMTLSELVTALNIHPSKSNHIYRLLRILTHSGFVVTQKLLVNDHEQEGYVLTAASQLLLSDNPWCMSPFLVSMLDPILLDPWHHLAIWFQQGIEGDLNPFKAAHGRMLWECCGHEPRLNKLFNDGMTSDARFVSSVLMNEGKGVLEGLGSLVDVGGGTGTMAMAIAKAFPNMGCTVLDLPHVVADSPDHGNLNFVGGDMFEAIPPADAVLLKWILHDWSNEECLKILINCKKAIEGRNGGKLLIIDMVMVENKASEEENKSMETKLFFDMLMMTLVTGQERNENEWSKLFTEAGFSNYNITPLFGLRSLIEVYP